MQQQPSQQLQQQQQPSQQQLSQQQQQQQVPVQRRFWNDPMGIDLGSTLTPFGGAGGFGMADPFAMMPFGGLGGGMTPFSSFGLGGPLAPFGGFGQLAASPMQAVNAIMQSPEMALVQRRAMAALPPLMRVDISEDQNAVNYVADLPGVSGAGERGGVRAGAHVGCCCH